MLIVRGVNIFPQQIERMLMSTPQVGRNYVIILSRAWTTWPIKVELAAAGFDGQVEHLGRFGSTTHREVQDRTCASGPKWIWCPPDRCPSPKAKPNA